MIQLGFYQEKIERIYPTPPEWSLKSRYCLRSARALQEPEKFGKLGVSWPRVGGYVKDLIERLESGVGDGEGVREVEEGGFLVEGVGRMGLDVGGKSEAWRNGYFEALMSAAKAAENMDGWLKDEVLRVAAPPEYVAGPANPDPKPPPKGMKGTMKAENCSAAYDSPEVYYMKILTTRGFGTREKVDAALAYADWLDFKGLNGTAGDMYSWAMDIAVEGVERGEGEEKKMGMDIGKVVDTKSGVLKDGGKEFISENLMRVSTALAVHHARVGELPTALSIFLSVLRARRDLDTTTPTTTRKAIPKTPTEDDSILSTITSFIVPPPYPALPPSGNTPPAASPCEEAALMTYIGEIIYASSSHEKGLAWTRDAVDMAESTIVQLGDEDSSTTGGGGQEQRCRECLQTSLSNWKTMIRTLVREAENEELDAIESPPSSSKGVQFWSSIGHREKLLQEKATQRRRWEAEEMILEERTRRMRPYLGVMWGGDGGILGFMPERSVFFM